jgi:hypothetical protein
MPDIEHRSDLWACSSFVAHAILDRNLRALEAAVFETRGWSNVLGIGMDIAGVWRHRLGIDTVRNGTQ